jgi:hypothetical protein
MSLPEDPVPISEIHKADPATRRQAIVLIVLAFLAGSGLMVAFEYHRIEVRDWFVAVLLTPGRRPLGAILLVGALTVPLVAPAFHFVRLGTRIVQAKRFPPEDQKVIRDTPIVRGCAAVRRGRLLQALGGGLLVLAVGLGVTTIKLRTLSPLGEGRVRVSKQDLSPKNPGLDLPHPNPLPEGRAIAKGAGAKQP